MDESTYDAREGLDDTRRPASDQNWAVDALAPDPEADGLSPERRWWYSASGGGDLPLPDPLLEDLDDLVEGLSGRASCGIVDGAGPPPADLAGATSASACGWR